MVEKRKRCSFNPIKKDIERKWRESKNPLPSIHWRLAKLSDFPIEQIPDHDTAEADPCNAQDPQVLHRMPEIARPEIFWRGVELVSADVPKVKCRELRQPEFHRIPKIFVTSAGRELRPGVRTVAPENRL